MLGFCHWHIPTFIITDISPPWWDFVMVGICRHAMIMTMMMMVMMLIYILTRRRRGRWRTSRSSSTSSSLPTTRPGGTSPALWRFSHVNTKQNMGNNTVLKASYMAICPQNIKKRIKDHNIDSDLIFCYFRIFRQNVGKILTHYLVKWKLVHSICWLIDCSRRRSAVPSKLETTVLSLGSSSTSRSFCVFKQTSKQTNKKKQKQKTSKITQKSINHCRFL